MSYQKPVLSVTLRLAFALLTVTLVWFSARASSANAAAPCPASAADGQNATATAVLKALWNGQDKPAFDGLITDDFRYLDADSTARALGLRGAAFLAGYLRSVLPNLAYTVDEIVADGGVVAVRWTAFGTQSGAYGLIAPTGAKVSWKGTTILKITEGKVSEVWSVRTGVDSNSS